jgi:hypothetical protein
VGGSQYTQQLQTMKEERDNVVRNLGVVQRKLLMAEERLATANNKAEQEAVRTLRAEERLSTTTTKAADEATKLTQRNRKPSSATGPPH